MHVKLSQLAFLFQTPDIDLKHFEKQLKMKYLKSETKRNSLHREGVLEIMKRDKY